MEELNLHESEYRFINLIWENEPVNSTDLAKLGLERLGWKKSTCYTVLKKLIDRGFVRNENALVTSIVERESVRKFKSEGLMDKDFGGSLPAFLTTFLRDRKLSREEAEEIQKMIEEAVE